MPPGADGRLIARRLASRLHLLAHIVSDLGLPMAGSVISNSFKREIDARRAGRHSSVPSPVSPGRLLEVEARLGGGRFHYTRAELEVRFLSHDVVRFSWAPGTEPVPYALSDHLSWPTPQVALLDREEAGWTLMSDSLVVEVSVQGDVVVRRRDRAASHPLHEMLAPTRSGRGWEHRFVMRPGGRFGGLGEQAGGVDLRGGSLALWNTDAGGSWTEGEGPLYIGIPVLVSTHEEGDVLVFFENSTRAVFDLGSDSRSLSQSASRAAGEFGEIATVRFDGGMLRSYFMSGDVAHLLDRYSELTGRPQMPPRWALGYHQSRWGYKNEEDVREVAGGYSRLGLPLSAIHLDIDYMDHYRVFTFDPARFPDPAALGDELAARGIRLVTIVDPGVKVDPKYRVFEDGEARDVFCRDPGGKRVDGVVWPGRAAFPDFTSPAVRTWWKGNYEFLTGRGIAGVWHDMNEPSSISLRGDPTLPLDTRHDMDGQGGDHTEAHNLYGLLMNRAGFEGLESARPERRPFILSRSGWASNQRYAWNWTGDASSTWQSMRQQIATLSGLGLSGVAFCGSDTGGFSGIPDDELYLRWLQMSVFTGLCRTHSVVGVPRREPWRFEEPTRSFVGAWIRFRYRLLPYLYTLAREAADSGAPLMRPLWWPSASRATSGHEAENPGCVGDMGDSALGAVDDEFLLGDALLVAPVCEPGAVGRSVVLPAGEWNGLFLHGPKALRCERACTVRFPTPVERLAVLVRSGTVLPLDDGFAERGGPCEIESDPVETKSYLPPDLDHGARLLALHCWPLSSSGAGSFFDDAGDGYGESRRDRFELRGAVPGGTAVLTWQREGGYRLPSRVRVVVHGFDARSVMADGEEIGPTEAGAVECGSFERLEFRQIQSRWD